jgi:hypothetical protein
LVPKAAKSAIIGLGSSGWWPNKPSVALVDVVDRVHSTPVGSDKAREADLVTENLLERRFIAAGEGAVQLVV